MTNEDIKAVEQAMGALRLIADRYASSEDGQKRFQDVLSILRGGGSNLFRTNMADALSAYLSNKNVEPVGRRAA
jgi:hypothetical protein